MIRPQIEINSEIIPEDFRIDSSGNIFHGKGLEPSWKIEKKKGHYRLYDLEQSESVPVTIGTIHDKTIVKFFILIKRKIQKK